MDTHSYIDKQKAKNRKNSTIRDALLEFFPQISTLFFLAFGAAEQAIQIIKIQQFCLFF